MSFLTGKAFLERKKFLRSSVKTVFDANGTEKVAECTLHEGHEMNFKTVEPQLLEVGGKIAYSYDVKFIVGLLDKN